ncbi:hypothetical protein SALBM135S_06095 [Streptomyces alboniger]
MELTKAAKDMGDLTAKAVQSHQALSGAMSFVGQATDALRKAALTLTTEVPKLGAVADRIDTTLLNGTAETAKAGRANAIAAAKIAGQVKAAGLHGGGVAQGAGHRAAVAGDEVGVGGQGHGTGLPGPGLQHRPHGRRGRRHAGGHGALGRGGGPLAGRGGPPGRP